MEHLDISDVNDNRSYLSSTDYPTISLLGDKQSHILLIPFLVLEELLDSRDYCAVGVSVGVQIFHEETLIIYHYELNSVQTKVESVQERKVLVNFSLLNLHYLFLLFVSCMHFLLH